MSLVHHFPINETGRDFVIGDIHGEFALVREAMRRIQFDTSKDRLFCCGDLIDRGADSARALRFLQLSFVHSCRGNHENNFLEIHADGEPSDRVLQWFADKMGAHWWLKLGASERKRFLALFERMPIAIEVETRQGPVGIVHANVPARMPWPTFKSLIEQGDDTAIAAALESRSRIKYRDCSGVQGVHRVYVGHSPQWDGALSLGNVVALDSGAFRSDEGKGHLTIAEIDVAISLFDQSRSPVEHVCAITRA